MRPGPMLFVQTPDLFYAVVIGGFIGAFAVLILAVSLAPLLARIVTVPKSILLPAISVLCVVGTYAVNNSTFDIFLMIFFGVLGFVLRERGYSVASLVLGLVLGNMMDFNLRKAVALAQTSDSFIVALLYRPITLVLLVMVISSFLLSFLRFRSRDRGEVW